ncbi:MAG TPA: AAA family ATPase [Pyrinomonadaceae bacterium]
MKKVSIINFKGGVGKTTLSLHLATFLARKQRVLLVDVDHQSSLSIVVLGQALWETCVKEGRTVNLIFESFCNRKISMPNTEIVINNAFNQRNKRYDIYPNLDFVSAQFELDDTEIDLASTTYGNANLSDWHKRTLLADWLDQINAQNQYDYVIFDCPPATKIMSQNALAASDSYVVPVIPDDISSRGVTHFRNLVQDKIDGKLAYLRSSAHVVEKDVPKNFVSATHLAGIVPFLVKSAGRARSGYTNIHTEQIAALRRRWKTDVIKAVGKNMTGVPEAVNSGWPVWNSRNRNVTRDVKSMMTSICEELKARIDK